MLRGKRGMRYKLRNVKGVVKGSWNNGTYDTLLDPRNGSRYWYRSRAPEICRVPDEWEVGKYRGN
ncbi:MAG: hypothetical protein WDO15_05390 [Bacteroidota bacterium]